MPKGVTRVFANKAPNFHRKYSL